MSTDTPYNIAILGAGRVGRTLGRFLAQIGHQITTVTCRSQAAAEHAVTFIEAGQPAVHDDFALPEAPLDRTVVLITTPDGAIAAMAEALARCQHSWDGITVFHCSGALSSIVLYPLRQHGAQVGSMHPLHAFGEATADLQELHEVHWTVEGDTVAHNISRQLIRDLGGQVNEIQPEHKILYHAAASIAGNYLTGLLSLSFTMLEQCGIAPAQARAMLVPLSEGLLQRLKADGEVAALAGPISRGDTGTVAQHLEVLSQLPPVFTDVYRSLGTQLVALARQKGTSSAALTDILRLLQH